MARGDTTLALDQSFDETGLTPELVRGLVADIRAGYPRRHAALKRGVSPKTFQGWLEDGAAGIGGPLMVELARRVYRWEARDVGGHFVALKVLARQNPQATELYLKLRYPEDFGGHVRSSPDEFELPERNQRKRAKLLSDPPPRMLAEMRAHDIYKLPRHMSAEDREAILAILAKYEVVAPALPTPEGPAEPE